jgi:hypothetical protein
MLERLMTIAWMAALTEEALAATALEVFTVRVAEVDIEV